MNKLTKNNRSKGAYDNKASEHCEITRQRKST